MMPRQANEAASNAMSAPIPSGLKSSPASTGPTITAMAPCALEREFAPRRPSGPPSSESIVYSPALPQAFRTDEPARSATYTYGARLPVAHRIAIVARKPARSQVWARTRTRTGRWRRKRPSARAPTTPGNVYAATAIPTNTPTWPDGASSTASQAEQQAAGLRVTQKPPVHRRDQAPSLLRSRHQGSALSLSSYFFCPAAHWLSPCAIGRILVKCEIYPPSLPRQDTFLLLQGKLIFLEILPCVASSVSQHLSQILARQRMLGAEEFSRCPLEDDHAALIAAFWTHINDPVGVANHIEMVLNHHHGVAAIDQPVHDGEQATNIRQVQPGRWLIHDIDTALLVQFAGQFHALAFSARERAQGLAQRQVVQTNITHRLKFWQHFFDGKKLQGLMDRHAQDISNGFSI